jgi:hypothetical protein
MEFHMDGHQDVSIPGKRFVLLDNPVADLIERLTVEEQRDLLELVTLMDCECGCRGRNHVRERDDAARRQRFIRSLTHETTRLRNQINLSISDR